MIPDPHPRGNAGVVVTDDGSRTLQTQSGVLFRSRFGALGESLHVFVDGAGLSSYSSPWRVLEVGVGTGMNLAALLLRGDEQTVSVHYLGIEKEPLPYPTIQQLSLPHKGPEQLFESLDANRTRVDIAHANHSLSLQRGDWLRVPVQEQWADVVFFDPFGPTVSPELWEEASFRRAADWLRPGGVLVTYGAAGHARRAMKSAGFAIQKQKGFGKKREMTRGVKLERQPGE